MRRGLLDDDEVETRSNRCGRALLVVVGVVNAVPALGLVSAEWMRSAYGLGLSSNDLALLLRHRAVLFGMLGASLVVAAWRPCWRGPTAAANAVSLMTFPILALTAGPVNTALLRVAALDIGAVAALSTGVVLLRRNRGSALC